MFIKSVALILQGRVSLSKIKTWGGIHKKMFLLLLFIFLN